MWNEGAFGALECPQVTLLLLCCVFREQFIILTSVLLWPHTRLFLQPPAPHPGRLTVGVVAWAKLVVAFILLMTSTSADEAEE